jgi:hypothetical protein
LTKPPKRHHTMSAATKSSEDRDLTAWSSVQRCEQHLRTLCGSFSLVEVIIAVGLFAATVPVILTLLPGLARQGAAARDSLAAQHLPDALQVELSRLSASGFDALAAQIPIMNGPLNDGLAFVADRATERLHSRDYLLPSDGTLAAGDQYFLIECWRFPDGPLQFEPSAGYLAMAVRVSWPYRLPGTVLPTDQSARSQFMFTVARNR